MAEGSPIPRRELSSGLATLTNGVALLTSTLVTLGAITRGTDLFSRPVLVGSQAVLGMGLETGEGIRRTALPKISSLSPSFSRGREPRNR